MVASIKLFWALVALCIIKGSCGASCGLSDIAVSQAATGAVIEGQPEYEVLVTNHCQCPQSKVFLQCFSLSSVEAVDSGAIKPVDDERCIVGGGRPLAHGAPVHGAPVRFKYAWKTPQDFTVVSSHIHC